MTNFEPFTSRKKVEKVKPCVDGQVFVEFYGCFQLTKSMP